MILLFACAPPGVLPPPVPFGDDAGRVGISGGYAGPIGADRPARPVGEQLHGALWTDLSLSRLVSLGFVAGVGGADLQGAGAVVRYTVPGRTRISLDVSAGWAWIGLGAALGGTAGPVDWYVAPAVLAKDTAWFRVPAGASARVGPTRIFAEAGVTSGARLLASEYPFGPMVVGYVSVGVAAGWPRGRTGPKSPSEGGSP